MPPCRRARTSRETQLLYLTAVYQEGRASLKPDRKLGLWPGEPRRTERTMPSAACKIEMASLFPGLLKTGISISNPIRTRRDRNRLLLCIQSKAGSKSTEQEILAAEPLDLARPNRHSCRQTARPQTLLDPSASPNADVRASDAKTRTASNQQPAIS